MQEWFAEKKGYDFGLFGIVGKGGGNYENQ